MRALLFGFCRERRLLTLRKTRMDFCGLLVFRGLVPLSVVPLPLLLDPGEGPAPSCEGIANLSHIPDQFVDHMTGFSRLLVSECVPLV